MKKLLIVIILINSSYLAHSQGLSFSYFIPKEGYLSSPVSPFSIRGVGFDFGLIGIETGFTLYSVGGLSMTGLPFEANKPLTGPHFTVLVPLQAALIFDTQFISLRLTGGGFGFYNINPRINYGNMDRAIRDFEGWQVANADFDKENGLGIGWITGISFEFHVSSNFSISAGVSYLKGESNAALTGTYTGAPANELPETINADYQDAAINLEGIEISLGVVLKKK